MDIVDGLFERGDELERVARPLAECVAGEGRMAVVEGPAGIGKTRLLGAAASLAADAGVRVLRARAGELEREFSLGVVRQLFEPVLAAADEAERAELLAGAAQLAEALLATADVGPGSLFAAYHGLYWLAANLAGRTPVALVVDDVHWCDAASIGFLDFLGRRLEGLPVLVLAGMRPNEPGAEADMLDALAAGPGVTLIRPRALTAEATAVLVRARLSDRADDAFCAACHEATGGNPLLVTELAAALAAEQVTPTAAHVARVREIGPEAVSRAVRLRLARLPAPATALAEAASVLGDGADMGDAIRLAGLGIEEGLDAATALVGVELLRPADAVEFTHPVVRAAVYAGLGLPGQKAAHLRAVRLLTEQGRSPEQVAAHILVCPPAGDAAAVRSLRDAARRAGADGDAQAAVRYLARALREPPPPGERVPVLMELGIAEQFVNGPAAVEHLREALGLTSPPESGRVAVSLARALYFTGRAQEAAETFEAALAEPGLDRDAAENLEAGLVVTSLFEPTLADRGRARLATSARPDAERTTAGRILLGYGAYDIARTRLDRDAAVAQARRSWAGGELASEDSQGAPAAVEDVFACADLLDEAEAVCRAVLDHGQRTGAVFEVVMGYGMRASVLRLRGPLAEAHADAVAAIDASAQYGFLTVIQWTLAWLVETLIDRGDVPGAAKALAAHGMDGALGDTGHLSAVLLARARLRLAQGRPDEAVDDARDVGRRFALLGGRNPAMFPWRTRAAEGLLGRGDAAGAGALAAEELALAREWGAPRPIARALRMQGLAVGGDDGLGLLREAIDVLDGSPALLERANALVELGAALRRANRRAEARPPLQEGADLATRLGARPLAERALEELLATGARPRRVAASGRESLTPSELRVAELAAQGNSNRDIAQRLFVTQKTVEAHLGRTFRKLRIESRAQLAGALGSA